MSCMERVEHDNCAYSHNNLAAASYGVRWNHNPAAASSPAIETHFAAFASAALLRRSRARPFATHACQTSSSSGFVNGRSNPLGDVCNRSKVDMCLALSFASLLSHG